MSPAKEGEPYSIPIFWGKINWPIKGLTLNNEPNLLIGFTKSLKQLIHTYM